MAVGERSVGPPDDGLWRIGRGENPLRASEATPTDLGDTKSGNRFDSLLGNFGTLYFGTTLEVCFGETLSRYRRDPKLAFIDDEWEELGFMKTGTVPADWRHRRTAVKVQLDGEPRFFNVENAANMRLIEKELGPVLAILGHDQLDVSVLRGGDRRVTRAIAQWVYQLADGSQNPVFAGIRYFSRTNTDWECWAVFDGVGIVEVERRAIVESTDGLAEVAHLFDLRVY